MSKYLSLAKQNCKKDKERQDFPVLLSSTVSKLKCTSCTQRVVQPCNSEQGSPLNTQHTVYLVELSGQVLKTSMYANTLKTMHLGRPMKSSCPCKIKSNTYKYTQTNTCVPQIARSRSQHCTFWGPHQYTAKQDVDRIDGCREARRTDRQTDRRADMQRRSLTRVRCMPLICCQCSEYIKRAEYIGAISYYEYSFFAKGNRKYNMK